MKTKPNTDQFKISKKADAFLEGGSATKAEQPERGSAVNKKVQREQKIFRLSIDLINTLKRESYERSVETGARVTETELVEQALQAFFGPSRKTEKIVR